MKKLVATVRHFCLIQLEIIKDRKKRLQKELLDCTIQEEFLTETLGALEDEKE